METTELPPLKITATPSKYGCQTITCQMGAQTIAVEEGKFNTSKERKHFTDRLVESHPGLSDQRKAIEKTLLNLAAKSVTNELAPDSMRKSPEACLAESPESARMAAEKLLKDPKLAKQIQRDIEALGVIGEANLALAVFIILLSRLLTLPLHAIIVGLSSSGKSFAANTTARLFPLEAVLILIEVSAKALLHAKNLNLAHMALLLGERRQDEHAREANRIIRQAKSERDVAGLTTQRDANGNHEAQVKGMRGPIATVETTTNGNIHNEERNRCLILNSDETAEQTKAVILTKARRNAQRIRFDTKDIIETHHAMQRILTVEAQTLPGIHIPFEEHLAEIFCAHPLAQKTEARRAMELFLGAIKAITLLHLRQRDRDEQGWLVATTKDYAIARTLFLDAMAQAIGLEVGKPTRNFLHAIEEAQEAGTVKEVFTRSDLVEAGLCKKSAGHEHLKELKDAGMLKVVLENAGPHGIQYCVRKKSKTVSVESLFPTAAELKAAIAAAENKADADAEE